MARFNHKKLLAGIALLAVAGTAGAQNVAVEDGIYSADWESLSGWECPTWFKDAKFGIWSHWGPQCEAEDGDWYARGMYFAGSGQYNYHVSHYGDPAEFGFKDVIHEWEAEEWNPDSLVRLYKDVGARYFFALGQHHDNFDLWDSPYQEWNSVNMGPKRDLLKGWSEACQKYGLPLGVSMHGSHTWTWFEIAQDYDGNLTKADGEGLWWDGYDPQELYAQRHTPSTGYQNSSSIHGQWDWGSGASQPSEAYKLKFQNRVLECVNDYNPDMLYFDDTVLPFYGCDENVGLNILKHFYNHRANAKDGVTDVVAMGKQLQKTHKKAMLWDVERGVPDQIQTEYWQTCTCIGSWHYDRSVYENGSYKSAQQVVDMLVDIVSKNGNLLLSVPIRGNGTIDEKERAILMDIKAWMDQNGQSIYGTRPWKTYGEGPLAESSQPLSAQGFNESNNYTASDVRYVQRNDTLYATILRWPQKSTFTFAHLGLNSAYYSGRVSSVQLLGHGTVDFSQDVDGLTVSLPDTPCNAIAPVFLVTFSTEEGTGISLSDLIPRYEARVAELELTTSPFNTGKLSDSALAAFKEKLQAAKTQTTADAVTQAKALRTLREAFASLQEDGLNQGGAPNETLQSIDLTTDLLVEGSAFAADPMGSRYGTPVNWTVENYLIPNSSEGDRHGIDRYPGYNCLSLGVWDDRDAADSSCDLANARIYRTVHLDAGLYYLGAAYQANYQLGDAYLFAATHTLSTADLPQQSLAYWPISKAGVSDTLCGVYFLLDEAQDVVLGFQANLTDNAEQEFRVSRLELISYGKMDRESLDKLILTADALQAEATVNQNTGFYSAEALAALKDALAAAQAVAEDASATEFTLAYETLKAAIEDFQRNGRNAGGAPLEGGTDMTEEKMAEADAFSRADATVTTRFAEPKYWTVENFSIPNGTDGTKRGIDKYPGYDCLYLGVWNDREANTEGNLANARLSRTVHLTAGRYYFGAQYQTTYNLNDRAYIYASAKTLDTDSIPMASIAWLPINEAPNGEDGWYGIFFTLYGEQDVQLGFQADLTTGSTTQEMRVKELQLRYYGTMSREDLTALATNLADTLATLRVNANTGFYRATAVDSIRQHIAEVQSMPADADPSTVEAAYIQLQNAFGEFLENGKNAGGQPEEIGATDLTTEKLVEAEEFAASPMGSRYGTPTHWTVENYLIPNASEGDRHGIDSYAGYNCLSLGVWDDGGNATSDCDLSNARIYRSVQLDAGTYYFGASYQTFYNLGDSYIFAATKPLPTADISTASIAYEPHGKASADGQFYGIYFTLDEAQDVLLGFQTDLTGAAEQEFRVEAVKLLAYDVADAIEVVSSDTQKVPCFQDNAIYDLCGRRVKNPVHGIYIMGGKKILIR